MLHTAIFIGRSGCGKGTQADLFKNRIAEDDEQKRHILYVETGDHFRKFIRNENYSSKLSNSINDKGELQPEFLACWMWANILVEELDENMHLVFDGMPRAEDEAAILSSALKFYNRVAPRVIYINVSRKWSEEKLLARHRADDVNLAKIDKRLDWFDKDTIPALEYLKNNKLFKFIEVDGEQTIKRVHADIMARYEFTN